MATTVRVEWPYLAFGPKAGQKSVLIYATDLGSAKAAALILFKPTKKEKSMVHVHLVQGEPPLTYSRA